MENQEILKAFVKHFLPPRGNQRKTTRNELNHVAKILSEVCVKYFGFRVTPPQLLSVFEGLGYGIYSKTRGSEGKDLHSVFHIDVSAPTIQLLGRLRASLPETTALSKVDERSELEKRVLEFKDKLQIT